MLFLGWGVGLFAVISIALAPCAVACTTSTSSPARSPARAETLSPKVEKQPLPDDIVEQSALPITTLSAQGSLSPEEFETALWEAQVVCFGETHSDPHHHYAQLEALRLLAARAAREQVPLGVGFEMFQQPFQGPLSAFVSGQLEEAPFLEQTEYKKRWAFDFALYRPLLRLARKADLAALALNAPRELSKQIGRQGLSSLSDEQRSGLPELNLDDTRHRAYFDDAMGAHPMPDGGPQMDDMYAAQVLWDESMADASAQWLKSQPSTSHLLVVAGAGHCHRSAIPQRIARRTATQVLSVIPVLASGLESSNELLSLYDVLVVLDDGEAETPASD